MTIETALRNGRFILTVGISAVIGAIVTVIVGAFNLGDAYRANQMALNNINAHISSLEKNYDALNSIVQEDRQAGRQIVGVQADLLRLAQGLADSTRQIGQLNNELSGVREAAGRIDERVLLLDEIIKHARRIGGAQ